FWWRLVYQMPGPGAGRAHVGGSAVPLAGFGVETSATVYVGLRAVLVNLVVVVVLTVLLRASRVPDGRDGTEPGDYLADEDDPRTGRAPSDEAPAPPAGHPDQRGLPAAAP